MTDCPQFLAWLDRCLDDAAASGIETGSNHFQTDVEAHLLEVSAPRRLQKVETGACQDVGAANQGQGACLLTAQGKRQIQGVQYQAGRSGSANVETITPRNYSARFENQILAAQAGALRLSLTDCRGGAH